MSKNLIRANMKEFLARMTPEERHARSLAACHNLITTREFKQAQMIMIFLSMPIEVETSTLAVEAWQEGKSIAAPRIDWNTKKMEPVEIKSLDVGLQTRPVLGNQTPSGAQSIREPVSGTVVPLALIDMVVIPGLAFDRRGYRVGRGRGFYDRFLAQQDFQGIRAALCFHEQLQIDALPCEPHDIPMNLVVTDKEVVRCSSHGGRNHG